MDDIKTLEEYAKTYKSKITIKQHDILIKFTEDGGEVWVQDELQEAIKIIAQTKGEFYIKVNWFSPDVELLYTSQSPTPATA